MKNFAMWKAKSYKEATFEGLLNGFKKSDDLFHQMMDKWDTVEELLESKYDQMGANQVQAVHCCREQMMKGFIQSQNMFTALRDKVMGTCDPSGKELHDLFMECKNKEGLATIAFGGVVHTLKELQYEIAGIIRD